MATPSRTTADRTRRPKPSGNTKARGRKKEEKAQSGPKRLFTYLTVVALLLAFFYAFQYFQMSQIRASLDQQISDAKATDARDLDSLKSTLVQVRAQFPKADEYSGDPVFSQYPMAGRIEAQTNYLTAESEKAIRDTRAHTPFIFITDIIMPGAQQSTDDHYRDAVRGYITSNEYKEFSTTKLRVDDLVSAIRFCRSEPTDLNYGYTDPVPDSVTREARATVIDEAGKRYLCPEKG